MHIISGIYHRLQWYWWGCKEYYARHYMKQPNVLSVDETLDLIINEHYSVSRNGDGELNIMLGRNIPFQKWDRRLADIMIEAHTIEMPKYISAVPDVFDGCKNMNAKATLYYKHFLHRNRYDWYKLTQGRTYGTSFVSRFYIDYVDKSHSHKQVARLKEVWKDQDVLLVEGKDSRLGVGNDLFDGAKSLKRILGPSENAFDVYDQLMSEVKNIAAKDSLILLALGPTATAMAYELAKAGYWAVDIGHVDIEYEWMLMGATTKVNVPGKYTNESTGDKITGSLPEEAIEKYQKEIITRIY